MAGGQSGFVVLAVRIVLILKTVGQGHRPDLQAIGEPIVRGQIFQNLRSESSAGSFFNDNESAVIFCKGPDEFGVQRLCKTGVRDCGRYAFRLK